MAGEEGIEPSSSVLPARRGTLLFIELSQLLAGVEGIEPSSLVLETSVLPLNYTPTKKCEKQRASGRRGDRCSTTELFPHYMPP